jgi:hypothetical protein
VIDQLPVDTRFKIAEIMSQFSMNPYGLKDGEVSSGVSSVYQALNEPNNLSLKFFICIVCGSNRLTMYPSFKLDNHYGRLL